MTADQWEKLAASRLKLAGNSRFIAAIGDGIAQGLRNQERILELLTARAKEPSPSTPYANGWICQCKLEGASVIHPTGTYCVGCNTYAPHCAPSTPEPYRNPWGGGDFGERLEDAMPSPPEQSAARMADGVREAWTRDVPFSGRVLLPDEDVVEGDMILLVGGSWITASGAPGSTAKQFIEVVRPTPHVRLER